MSFQPAFEVTQVKSMQWNRTIAYGVSALPASKPIEISKETLQLVKQAISREMSQSK